MIQFVKRRWRGVAALGWSILATATAGLVYIEHEANFIPCAAPTGDSNYGEFSWSWLPIGHECTWTLELNEVSGHRGADWMMTLWIVALTLVGLLAIVVARRSPR